MEWIYNLTREGNNLYRLSCIHMAINVFLLFSKKIHKFCYFSKALYFGTKILCLFKSKFVNGELAGVQLYNFKALLIQIKIKRKLDSYIYIYIYYIYNIKEEQLEVFILITLITLWSCFPIIQRQQQFWSVNVFFNLQKFCLIGNLNQRLKSFHHNTFIGYKY